jgi:hypothetical protein
MSVYREFVDEIQVPRNVGIDGFVHTVRELLKKERVQDIHIDARGTITCRRYVLEGNEAGNTGVDFEGMMPGAIVRNTDIREVLVPAGASAASVLIGLMDTVAVAHLVPVAFVTGADSRLWSWYERSTGAVLQQRDTILGLPCYTDRMIPDTALILAAGYGKDAAFVDSRKSYKIEMPERVGKEEVII